MSSYEHRKASRQLRITDKNGMLELSGFLGEYELVIGGKTVQVKLEKGTDVVTVQI
ncbi:MAG: hypothetical protein MJ124_05080 [Lachnospiraceae bacterium]|nr:hypothetical protein [Lachnospiraceae bacterium]